MTPAFYNSAIVRTPERFVLAGGRWKLCALKVRFGLIVHPEHGPVLLDTGYSRAVTQGQSRSLFLRLYNRLLGPKLIKEGALEEILKQHGYTCADVRIIVVTHFHADHVAALKQFENARFICSSLAFEALSNRGCAGNIHRGIFPELLPKDFAQRLSDVADFAETQAPLLSQVGRDIFGDGSLLAIDLPGHAEGHFGLCFPNLAPPLLYATDVQWTLAALREMKLPGFPASLTCENRTNAQQSAAQVAAFMRLGGEVMLCHDPMPARYDVSAQEAES